jgi:hypothetical protein
MDDILLWILSYKWLLILVVFGVGILLSLRYYRGVSHVFEAQALKRQGIVVKRYLRTTLRFTSRDHQYIVSQFHGSRYHLPYSRVVTHLHKPGVPTLKLTSESWGSEIGKKLGMQDIQIGSSEFDDRFMIKGNNEVFAINLLTYRVQDKLLALRKFTPTVALEGDQLMITVPEVFKKEEELDLLIETAFTIIERLEEI